MHVRTQDVPSINQTDHLKLTVRARVTYEMNVKPDADVLLCIDNTSQQL